MATAKPQPSSRTTSTTSYSKATFVPPAAPSIVSPLKPVKPAGWPSAVNHPSRVQQQIANGYGTSQLHAKKKKGGGGGAGTATATKGPKKGQVQVMMLETVPKVGQKGDIICVSTAVFQNQLKLSNKARAVSEEEMKKLEQEKEAHEQELLDAAIKTKSILEEAMIENLGGEDNCDVDADICGVALKLKRKAGPEGNLFGGVNPKMVMDELAKKFPSGGWEGKQVKLTEVKDVDGNDVKKKDIKHTGDFTCTVQLHPTIDVTFILSITAE